MKINIFRISELNGLKWVNLIQMTIISTLVGKKPLQSTKETEMQYLVAISVQNGRMILVHFQSEPFNITVIQAHAPVTNAEEAEVELFYKELQASRINIKKYVLFIIGNWNAEV